MANQIKILPLRFRAPISAIPNSAFYLSPKCHNGRFQSPVSQRVHRLCLTRRRLLPRLGRPISRRSNRSIEQAPRKSRTRTARKSCRSFGHFAKQECHQLNKVPTSIRLHARAHRPRLLDALFPILVATHSKSLRIFIFQKILSDIRSVNAKATNHRLNRAVQNTLYNLVTSDKTSSKGLWAVKFTRELWKRQIWTDAKAVDIMKEAALADNEKVIIGGIRFFLGGDKEREELEDDSSDEEAVDMSALRHQMGINKKTKKRGRDLKKAAATVKRVCFQPIIPVSTNEVTSEREEKESASSFKLLGSSSSPRPPRFC